MTLAKNPFNGNDPQRKLPQAVSRSLVWQDLKTTGRRSLLFLVITAAVIHLHSWEESLQMRKQVLTPEVEGRLLQEFPESTPGQRQKIALAEHETRRARAEVAGELRYQEVLSQPLFGDSPPSASSIDFKES